ncbi:transcriptional regulator ATRX homolog isoform X1 [Coffea eugenioides]|uniref:transcriptional regulator ATRX homolog isoform X1 n=2 Tax=Coffea eugenioides TaxID=49369 RepID=UPI000F60693D|nr:transcriptional regulator ATRX homolog isoform X1 [Coffea eugenioides]
MPSEDAKTVKKERVKDEDEETLDSLKKKKPNNATQKEAKARTKRVKKEEADEDFEQSPPKKSSNKSSDKVQKRRKKEDETKKKEAKETEQTAKKREKKVYDLPGQRREPPEERDPLRIFYETLYKQVPNSEMAAIWMMESGLLQKEAAKKIFEKKQKKAPQQKVKSPVKAVGTVKSKVDSVTIKRKTSSAVSTQKKRTLDSKVVSKQSKKCKIADSSSESGSDDDDFILKAKNSKKQKAG